MYTFLKKKVHLQFVYRVAISTHPPESNTTLSKLHSQSLGNIISNRCPCDFHLTRFHKDTTKLHLLSRENAFLYCIILNRLHRLRVQLLGIFIGAGGGRLGAGHTLNGTNAWFSQLPSSPTALTGRYKQSHQQTGATYTYLSLNHLLITI